MVTPDPPRKRPSDDQLLSEVKQSESLSEVRARTIMIKPMELVTSFTTRSQEEQRAQVEEDTIVDKPPQILIVDDNTFNVFSLKLLIEEYFNFRTDTAYSAKEAIEKVQINLAKGYEPYKLILTDINMPETDGFQMTAQILQIVKDFYKGADPLERVTVYAVTAMNDSQIKDRHLKYGIKEVLTKPIKSEKLALIFESLFENSK